jgi:hypothetical protein
MLAGILGIGKLGFGFCTKIEFSISSNDSLVAGFDLYKPQLANIYRTNNISADDR